jgi:hypothetical protein
MKVELPNRNVFLERQAFLPESLWRAAPFKFDPQTFILQSPSLEEKVFNGSVQQDSYDSFVKSPFDPIIYGVASCPDDTKAKQFAAFLCSKFIKATTPVNSVAWVSSSFNRNKEGESIKDAFNKTPALLVITGLSPNNSSSKLDLVAELVDHHQNIPRILVISGQDPVEFLYTKLHLPIHSIYFHSSNVVRRKSAVI